MCAWSIIFNTCIEWALGSVVHKRYCATYVGNTEITDFVFAYDAVIFAESLDVLVIALEALHNDSKLLGLGIVGTCTDG